jgi:hypothetical protein
VSLVGRYQGKSGVGKEKWFRNHWTVPDDIMDALREGLDLETEVVASPLNVNMGTKAYCSVFDRDKLFGYVGTSVRTSLGTSMRTSCNALPTY